MVCKKVRIKVVEQIKKIVLVRYIYPENCARYDVITQAGQILCTYRLCM